jgi:hypothetical protein
MPVPGFQTLMLPLLGLASDGEAHTLAESVEQMAQHFHLSSEDRSEVGHGGQNKLYNRVGWAATYLKKARLLEAVGPGRFRITDSGQGALATKPTKINVAFLESNFPAVLEFTKNRSRREGTDEEPPVTFNDEEGTWQRRPGVEERIRQNWETLIPNESVRTEALGFLAFAIENADEERNDAWYLREMDQKLRLMTGRLLACEVGRSTMRVSVIGPVNDDVRNVLGVESENDSEFKWIPGGLLITFPIEHAADANNLLKDSLNSFVDLAMARVRRAVSLEEHTPEAVDYIAHHVGRDLPQPVPDVREEEQFDDANDEEDERASREPRVRGRAPIFEPGQRSIASLMEDIEREVIALPDLQRPFVWEDTKVRDLLDSLFVGFPVGTLVFWHTSNERDARALGAERPGLQATTLVIDGQQRLT